MLSGTFTYDMHDMNGSISADMQIKNIPTLPAPISLTFTTTSTSKEDASVSITEPEDAISAADL